MLTSSKRAALRKAPLTSANKITKAKELAGVTQIEIAAGVHLTQASVSRIENGNYSRLPGETMRAFADYFGCQIEDLFPSREAMSA